MGKLVKRQFGFSLRQLGGMPRRNMYPLWKWMRGPSGLSMALGFSYGGLIGLAAGLAIVQRAENPTWADLVFDSLFGAVALGFLGMLAGMGMSELVARSGDPFYRYGRRCRALIGLKACTPQQLDTRRRVAKVVGLWAAEVEKMKIDPGPCRSQLEAIVGTKILMEEDLNRVAEIGRQAALAPLRGEVDMLALTPDLMPGWRAPFLRPALPVLLANVGAIISILVTFKDLIGTWS